MWVLYEGYDSVQVNGRADSLPDLVRNGLERRRTFLLPSGLPAYFLSPFFLLNNIVIFPRAGPARKIMNPGVMIIIVT